MQSILIEIRIEIGGVHGKWKMQICRADFY